MPGLRPVQEGVEPVEQLFCRNWRCGRRGWRRDAERLGRWWRQRVARWSALAQNKTEDQQATESGKQCPGVAHILYLIPNP